jgi:uncharacterized protein
VIHRIPSSDYREAPWKNGGGLSYEIAADDFTPPAWRVSVARIDRAGPFSDFSGYDRTIVALDGGTVELDVNGERVPLERNIPYAFPGEAKVLATLDGGAARDLNVMTQRNEWLHDVEIVSEPARFVLDEDEFALVYVIAGAVNVENERCLAGDALAIEECDSFGVAPEAGATACVIRVTPI